MTIKNINLEVAFDEVKGKNQNELRATQTDIFASKLLKVVGKCKTTNY